MSGDDTTTTRDQDWREALHDELARLTDDALHPRERLGERLFYLRDLGRRDLALARLVEGHLDALAILDETDMEAAPGALYAVWASGGPQSRLTLEPGPPMRLSGTKAFCSGSDFVQRALVWVDDDERLVEVDLEAERATLTFHPESWKVDALRETHTWTVDFSATPLRPERQIDRPKGWYFRRPGFWHGALCPAACWAGGALRLVEDALERKLGTPHEAAHVGAMVAQDYAAYSVLGESARAAMDDLQDGSSMAYPRALATRQVIERACAEIIDRHGRAFGPRPLAFEPELERHIAALRLYVRQCHGERDLAELGERASRWRQP